MQHRATLALFVVLTVIASLAALWWFRDSERKHAELLLARQSAARNEQFTKDISERLQTLLVNQESQKNRTESGCGDSLAKLSQQLESLVAKQEEFSAPLAEILEKMKPLKGQIERLAAKPDPNPRTDSDSRVGDVAASARGQLDRVERLVTELGAQLAELRTLEASRLETFSKALQIERAEREQADARLRDLLRRIAQDRSSSPRKNSTAMTTAATPPPAALEASVREIDRDAGIVVVDAGTEVGISIGHTLFVRRGSQPIGTLRVLTVYAQLAGAEIVQETESLRVGDSVTSKPVDAVGSEAPSGSEPTANRGELLDPVRDRRERVGPPPESGLDQQSGR